MCIYFIITIIKIIKLKIFDINIDLIFRSGCDLNSPRREGAGGRGGDEAHDLATPLHLCCTWGLEEVVQVLLEHGANINAQVRVGLY